MKHYKTVFENEQELLQALIDIHLKGKDIEIDPMYFKGNFYKNGINKPKYISDKNPQNESIKQIDFENSTYYTDSYNSIILDPPFMISNRPSQKNYYSSKTHTFYESLDELKQSYFNLIKEAYRILEKKGVLIFKCQDFTDSKTIFTHTIVQEIAERVGFYTKDLAILVKPNKVYNGNLTQRHLRKIHTYFWIFIKK